LVLAAKEQSHFLETLRAILPLKLSGRETERRARWQHLLSDVFNRDVRTEKISIVFNVSQATLTSAATLAVFYFGARLVMDNELTLGMLIAFASYQVVFTGRMQALVGFAFDWRLLRLHAERLADLALEAPEEEPAQETDVQRLAPRIQIRGVSFRYADGEPWVIHNLSLQIEPGESVVLVGPSGCGKSTLTKIILGILTPTEGEVLLDGVPIGRLGLRNYRKLIGAVLQEDHLLSGSLADNIAFFDTTADQGDIEVAARVAAIHEEINGMPMGYQTLVGDLGTSLSGGQKQRVLLARALYKKPKILVLDEATSHLDVYNEGRVNDALSGLSLTRIIVAHRPETIASAGRVIELGPLRVEAVGSTTAVNV
jgi:ATP-binding cassette, subfamily B, bacterial CvaB/MchF/RaxB